MIRYTVVIPTVGRPCLAQCLQALAAAKGPDPEEIVLADDRPRPDVPLERGGGRSGPPVRVVRTGGAGPAAARNAGWHAADTPWVAFLDDDVRVGPDWKQQLDGDLAGLGDRVAGSQGRITVPLPARRRTDWERTTAGLAGAKWITADMACRRAALADCGGFDERFPRAFREDADLALRLLADGWQLTAGQRRTEHPVRPASRWISVRAQRGNADDALMRALHGRSWHRRADAPAGRLPRHAVITGAAVAAAGLGLARRRRAAAVAAGLAAAGTAEFALARIRPGPRTAAEITAMTLTSLVIPPAACWHRLRGTLRWRGAAAWPPPARAVLFDRDGTLIEDVPYNGDPARVRPVPAAAAAVAAARQAGAAVGMITNQSGIARGLLTAAEARAVSDRAAGLTGPFDIVEMCPHGPDAGCGCRKPAPGMVRAAAAALGVPPHECAVIGDIAADVAAARAAGARGVLVPAPGTDPADATGVRTAPDLLAAVAMVTGGRTPAPVWAQPA